MDAFLNGFFLALFFSLLAAIVASISLVYTLLLSLPDKNTKRRFRYLRKEFDADKYMKAYISVKSIFNRFEKERLREKVRTKLYNRPTHPLHQLRLEAVDNWIKRSESESDLSQTEDTAENIPASPDANLSPYIPQIKPRDDLTNIPAEKMISGNDEAEKHNQETKTSEKAPPGFSHERVDANSTKDESTVNSSPTSSLHIISDPKSNVEQKRTPAWLVPCIAGVIGGITWIIILASITSSPPPARPPAPPAAPQPAATITPEDDVADAIRQTPTAARGIWADNVFTSDFLGLRFNMPPDWNVVTGTALGTILYEGAEIPDYAWNLLDPPSVLDMSVNNPLGGNLNITIDRLPIPITKSQFLNGITETVAELEAEGLIVNVGSFDDPTKIGRYYWYYLEFEMDLFGVPFIAHQFTTMGDSNRFAKTITISGFTAESLEDILAMFSGYDAPDYITIRGEVFGTSMTVLDLSGMGLTDEDIVSLRYMTNLDGLSLSNNQISDLRPLSGLMNLTNLLLWDNQISDLTPLSNLTNLTLLTLGGNQISDLTPLSNLTNLTRLGLAESAISDLTPISGLTNLEQLSLTRTAISDLSPLSGLMNLEVVWLEDNPITNWSPVAHVPQVYGRP